MKPKTCPLRLKTIPLIGLFGVRARKGQTLVRPSKRGSFATRFCRLVSVLSQSSSVDATTSGQKSANVCPLPQNAIPLPTQTSNNACHCNARALTMEELENVNGGHPHTRLTWPGKNNLKRIDQIVNNIKKLFNAK